MGLILTPSVFTAQPQYPAPIDQSDPLVKGLVFANNAALGPLDLVSGKYATTWNGSRPATTQGISLANTGAAAKTAEWGFNPMPGSGDLSYAVLANPFAEARESCLIGVMMNQVFPFLQIQLFANFNGSTQAAESGTLCFESYNGGAAIEYANASGVVDGKFHLFVGVHNAASGTRKVYVDGIDKTTASSSFGSGWSDASSRISVGSESYNTGNRVANCQIPLSLAWNRALTKADVALLKERFWRFLKAEDELIWVPSGSSVPLASNSAPTATGSGTLSVKIPITGASAAGVTGQGTLSIALPLAGAGNAAVVGSATLSVAQALSGASSAVASGSGTLNLAIALNSAALATALGSGTLNGSVALGGNAAAGVAGSGTLKLSLALSSAAIANALGSGNLAVTGSLGGASVASVTGSGSLNQAIPIQSASLAATNASGTLTQLVPITGSSSVLASGQGALHLTVNLNAQALAQAIGVGNLTLRIALNGASIANAIATGALSGIVRPINPKYSIIGYARIRSITAVSRVRSVVGM